MPPSAFIRGLEVCCPRGAARPTIFQPYIVLVFFLAVGGVDRSRRGVIGIETDDALGRRFKTLEDGFLFFFLLFVWFLFKGLRHLAAHDAPLATVRIVRLASRLQIQLEELAQVIAREVP